MFTSNESRQTTQNEPDTARQAGKFSHMARKIPRLRVLVVDDEPLIRWSVAETLTDCGHVVTEAPDAQSALTEARESPARFDVVMLDFRLPDSNDLTLLSRLRALMPHVPIIMMTAFGTPDMFQKAIELGAYQVIHKPFEVDDVADLVLKAYDARVH
jgi:DNA-binding NtrC family response regulator